MNADAEMSGDGLLDCPTCRLPAEIVDRFTLDGAPGPVEHVKLSCVRGHWFTVPTDGLPALEMRPGVPTR